MNQKHHAEKNQNQDPNRAPNEKFPWGWIALLLLMFLPRRRRDVCLFQLHRQSPDTEPKSSVEQPVTVEKSEKEHLKKKQPDVKEESDVLYVKTRNT